MDLDSLSKFQFVLNDNSLDHFLFFFLVFLLKKREASKITYWRFFVGRKEVIVLGYEAIIFSPLFTAVTGEINDTSISVNIRNVHNKVTSINHYPFPTSTVLFYATI